MNENFYQLLKYAFSRNPQGAALLLPDGREISYRDLAAQGAAYSALLGELGVGVGDRILVQTAKSAEVVALYLGCLRAGDNPNRICDHAELQIDLRLLPGMDSDEVLAELRRRIDLIAGEHGTERALDFGNRRALPAGQPNGDVL